MNYVTILFMAALLSGCVNKSEPFPYKYAHLGAGSEYAEVRVNKGASRELIEVGLARDQVGDDRLTSIFEENLDFKRINSDEDFEAIIASGLIGDDESLRELWRKYPNATYSALECDNSTIVFFDEEDKAITSWPNTVD